MSSSDKKHILFVTSWYPKLDQSSGTFIEMHALALQSHGHKCAILLNGETTLGNYFSSGRDSHLAYRRHPELQFIENLTVHKTPLRIVKDPLAKRRANILKNTKKVIERYIAKNGEPDLIFHHGVFDFTYISSFLREEFGWPIWLLENSPNMTAEEIPCGNPFQNGEELVDFAQQADRRFAVTEKYCSLMEELFQVPYELCPNVLTEDFFLDPDQVSKPTDYFKFINVAILDKRKNQKLIVEAFANKFRENEKVVLEIIGDGRLLGELRDLAKELRVESQVSIPGFKNREELKRALDESHCFVLASHAETFGVVVIEAMARGIPVISSDIDGTREILRKDNGLLFESDNVEELGERMVEMMESIDQFNPEKVIDSVKSRFGPDAVDKALFNNG